MEEEDGGIDDCTAIVCFITRGSTKAVSAAAPPLSQTLQSIATAEGTPISRHVSLLLNSAIAEGRLLLQTSK